MPDLVEPHPERQQKGDVELGEGTARMTSQDPVEGPSPTEHPEDDLHRQVPIGGRERSISRVGEEARGLSAALLDTP
jgi:hypothetical protein